MNATGKATLSAPDFDVEALRRKYREERDKRLRPDANAQYIEIKGDFKHYVDDPYVAPGFTRDPIVEDVEVLVVGGGFGGLLMGARLRESGVDSLRIVEIAGDFGGTWYWNRYPGAQCDIESYCYLPLLEQTNYMPKEKYSYQPEIYAHAQRIAKAFDLYRAAVFQTQIKEVVWNEELRRWIVTTNRDDTFRARYVVMSSGPLSRPKLPGIPGIDSYKGHSFHTSRWDYGYSGGSIEGNLDKLKDKRVALIGTGGTALQVVPHLGASAHHLYVFQRTPTSVDVRNNRPTDPEWVNSLTPGWQQRRMDNFNTLVNGGQQAEDLVGDGWTEMMRSIAFLYQAAMDGGATQDAADAQAMEQIVELADFQNTNRIRARVDAIVKDPKTAEGLKAWYRQFCKRPGFHDTYLQTFNRPNVTLVDTEGRGVERVTEKGLVFDGVEYEVDCIVFATGFEVGTAYTRRSGFEAYGVGGKSLSDYWANGMRTFHGFYSHEFPNLFHLGMTQNAISPNFTHVLNDQAGHIAAVLKETRSRGATRLEPTAEAEAAWVRTIKEKMVTNLAFRQECTPGYYNGEGQAGGGQGLFDELYAPGPLDFYPMIEAWRSTGEFAGLDMC